MNFPIEFACLALGVVRTALRICDALREVAAPEPLTGPRARLLDRHDLRVLELRVCDVGPALRRVLGGDARVDEGVLTNRDVPSCCIA